jgi:hypothetical protein
VSQESGTRAREGFTRWFVATLVSVVLGKAGRAFEAVPRSGVTSLGTSALTTLGGLGPGSSLGPRGWSGRLCRTLGLILCVAKSQRGPNLEIVGVG